MNVNCTFISYPEPFRAEYLAEDPAPLFRKHFNVEPGLQKATMRFCPLGLGVAYINDMYTTEDLFLTPTSDYNKTVWYTEHDVTDCTEVGDNLIAVALGNGFYNECLKTSWDFDAAPWRDVPKLWLELELDYKDHTDFVTTDTTWLCEKDRSPYRFNQYHSGEIYDANYMTTWWSTELDDSDWRPAVVAKNPTGVVRLCTAPPIREDRTYECIELFKNRAGDYVFDFGQNMSGYVNLFVNQPKGTRLKLIFAEELDADGNRKSNTLTNHYRTETQFAEIVAGEEAFDWSPDFSYSGFRFVIVSGAVEPMNATDMVGIFVHQNMRLLSDFHCSNKIFEKLFRLSRMSTLSNLFYIPTDCPTREKLGWCNDAAASAEQMIQNMDMSAFYDKWLQDLLDAMLQDGDLPGIVPSSGWGYAWGSGPISTSVLFEVPYRLYQYTGDQTQLKRCYAAMCKHLQFLEGKRDPETGLCAHGLSDWAGPFDPDNKVPVPLEFTCTALLIKFYRIAAMAAEALGDIGGVKTMREAEADVTAAFKKAYMLPDGRCAYEEQTAISMVVTLGLYTDLPVMKQQLLASFQKHNMHFYLGMLGMQFLLPACDICGLQEEGYALLNATGYPSYSGMFDDDATTLYETFGGRDSHNHHMYSCVIAWFHNTILGIRQTEKLALERTITLQPYFPKAMTYANGTFETVAGTIRVDWQRNDGGVTLYVDIPQDVQADLSLIDYVTVDGQATVKLTAGRNVIETKPV